ncbi:MAG: hypothetical protein LBG94_10220 [Treponema sp.]|jgi:hypothetical protein|nr:hypothetical protein [Treponema sp.]
MCVQNQGKLFLLSSLVFLMAFFFGGCEAIDTILPSAGSYRINVEINNTSLDDCSFITSTDKIRPLFENSVSKDPDVTGLVVFIKDSRGEITGSRVTYSLDDDKMAGTVDDTVIPVDSLDGVLPAFPLPDNLSTGSYTIVSQVMSGKDVLQRTEKLFYYLGITDFSYEGINVYLPGIAESLQLIPRGTVIMLEVDLDFSGDINPYVIWYEGRRKIREGTFADGAGQLLWKAPDQSGFFSLRAEVFPVKNPERLTGYSKDISLLVSSKTIDMHFASPDNPQLVSWYTFEGNLNNSKIAAGQAALNAGSTAKWMGANGTYGLVTGHNYVTLPKVTIPENEIKTWQVLFRFKPVADGGIFHVSFESSRHTHIYLTREDRNLILTLTSAQKTVSQVFSLPEADENSPDEFFHIAGVSFSVAPHLLSAQINYADGIISDDHLITPVSIEAEIENGFQIFLGFLNENVSPNNSLAANIPAYTAIWDEFALYYMPSLDKLFAETKSRTMEEPHIAAVTH